MKILDRTHDFSFALSLARKYREKYGRDNVWVEEKYIKGETWFYVFAF